MKKSNLKNAALASHTVGSFFDQFDMNDYYNRLVLEVIFQELYDIKDQTLSVSGQKRQEGNQNTSCIRRQGVPTDQSKERERIEVVPEHRKVSGEGSPRKQDDVGIVD